MKSKTNDQTVYIIGGGPSVSDINVSALKDQCVIGCNNAYTFGTDIVDYVIFGDESWYNYHCASLSSFPKEKLITNHPKLANREGITCYERREVGFFELPTLGWNGNTGAMAINFALTLGATKIMLLGFDMKLNEKKESNWHPNTLDTITEEHYERYMNVMKSCLLDLRLKWPKVKIINCNKNSAMKCFPRRKWQGVA